jgi:PEP-CTERM motif
MCVAVYEFAVRTVRKIKEGAMMKKLIWLSMLVGFFGLLRATPILAISLDFVPVSQTVGLGQSVTVDVVISNLGAGIPLSVGAFDLDVNFDLTILSPTDVTFGPFLGDPGPFEALTSFTFSPGVADFAEVSLLSVPALDALQPASFTLATLSFDTLAVGTSPLTFSQVIVDDAFGNKLTIDAGSGSVNVVPEPGTFLLLVTGLVGLLGYGWRRYRTAALY